MQSSIIKIIVAYDLDRGIGRGGILPWHLPEELRFVSVTTRKTTNEGLQNALVMGRRTFESIPVGVRPLPERKNVVISRKGPIGGVDVFPELRLALTSLFQDAGVEDIFIFGGEAIYALAVQMGVVEQVLATEIMARFGCDRFFPSLPDQFTMRSASEVPGLPYKVRRVVYGRDPQR
jgi:dihydrofolate reductase